MQNEDVTTKSLTTTTFDSRFEVGVKNGILVFKNSTAYWNVVEETDPTNIQDFANLAASLNYNSFGEVVVASNPEKDGLYPGVLDLILNQDEMVWIGDHIYKISPQTDRVLVMSSGLLGNLSQLQLGQIIPGIIRSVPMVQDVIDVVEKNQLGCNDDNAPNRENPPKAGVITVDNESVQYSMTARYKHLGIGYDLRAEVEAYVYRTVLKPVTDAGGNITMVSTVEKTGKKLKLYYRATRQYKPKCKDDSGQHTWTDYKDDNVLRANSYNMSRRLAKYDIYAIFQYKDLNSTGGCLYFDGNSETDVRVTYGY